MSFMRALSTLALSALAVTIMAISATRPALADDKVDCSRLDLQFPPAANADWTECERYQHSDGDADSATADVEMITADMGTHVLHIASVVAGRNTYFDKQPVSKRLSGWDELEKFADVQTEAAFERYQVIRFHASLWKAPMSCFGFVRYMGASIGQGGGSYGSKGFVAGYDCWRDGVIPDRAQIEATLDAIDN
jgi:hypothetical protein